MKERIYLGRWRSPKAELRFRAMEDELWREQSGPKLEALDVETSFGPTRAYRWRGTGTPLVFLHGIGGTGLIWAPFAEALAGRDVYALDIMGDVGRSEHRVPYKTSADLAVWLDEALAALDIDRAILVGHSLGGFVALDTAVYRPERVASLFLFDPVGIAPLQFLKFLLWGLPILFGSLFPAPIRRWIARRFRMPLLEDRRIMRMGLHGHLHHPVRFPPLLPFSDDELRSITAPVVVVVGEKSEMLDARVTVERAGSLIPNVETHVVADAGHALTVSHFDDCLVPLLQAAPGFTRRTAG
jgi:pimeloyl-ACP methyl ester carboxylesterase